MPTRQRYTVMFKFKVIQYYNRLLRNKTHCPVALQKTTENFQISASLVYKWKKQEYRISDGMLHVSGKKTVRGIHNLDNLDDESDFNLSNKF